jgi:hypothetical protein
MVLDDAYLNFFYFSQTKLTKKSDGLTIHFSRLTSPIFILPGKKLRSRFLFRFMFHALFREQGAVVVALPRPIRLLIMISSLERTLIQGTSRKRAPIHSMNMCVTCEDNQNLTPAAKLLLQWHYRLGHKNLGAIQRLMRQLPEVFPGSKFAAAAKCNPLPRCAVC